MDSDEAYAQIFANERGRYTFVFLRHREAFDFILGIIVDRQQSLWIKSKRLFLRVGTAEKKFFSKLKQKIEDFEERKVELNHRSIFDEKSFFF